MTTTQSAPPTLLLPVGQFFGTFHPTAGSTDRYHRVRLRTEVWELDDARFTVWALAHGQADQLTEQPWTMAALREVAAAHLPGDDVAQLLRELFAEGLAAEVTPGTAGAVEFARRHRMGARMLGLGNSSEQPWLYSIGFYDRPLVSVTRSVYDLWERCPSGESLWTMCESLAEEERRAGGDDPDLVDPERMLAGLLGTLHQLLTTSVVYLEPQP